ncbi:MAG: tetratricopeptide repeat protein [Betaproteobacteria bacterium]
MGRRLALPLRALRVLATVAMIAACMGAFAAQGEDEARAGAVAQLLNRDATARVAACNVLAEVGRPEDVGTLQTHLFDADEDVRAVAEAAIWAIWSRGGDKATDKLFTRGVAQMRGGDLQKALKTFTDVITARPDFTEAWNKRATIYFLLGDDVSSLKDCDEVYKRNPQHFGVLAGYGQIYLRNGDLQRALDYFERADAINPNMPGVRLSIKVLRERIAKRGRRYI